MSGRRPYTGMTARLMRANWRPLTSYTPPKTSLDRLKVAIRLARLKREYELRHAAD